MAGPGLSPDSYKEVILFLATAGIVVPLAARLRISPVLGFLGAGALLGPYGLGRVAQDYPVLSWFTIANRAEIAPLAEFGVVFLLFMIGIELSWERLRVLRRLVFGLGSLQVAVCAAVLAAIAYGLRADMTAAVIIGFALALSSTAIAVPVLAERRRLASPAGRATFSVLLFQDLAVAPVLFAVAVLGAAENGSLGGDFLLAFAKAALAIAAIVLAGRVALRPLFHVVAASRSPELFMAASLLVVVGTAVLAAATGLSMALGAFLAGLLLAETEYRRAIESTIEPFKGLLLGVFFVSVGMSLNVAAVIEMPVLIVSLTLGLILVKTSLIFLLARSFRIRRGVAFETALMLGAGGEFAFVILGAATAGKLVPGAVVQAVLLVVTLSMMMIPLFANLAVGFGRRLERTALVAAVPEPPPPSERPRVIITGFGRVGLMVAEMLDRHGIPYLAVDADPSVVAAQRKAGREVFFGDASNRDFLRRCGVDTAPSLVVTLDTPSVIEAVVQAARGERPDICIVARARDARHAKALYEMGVNDAVPETIEASLQLSEAVLVDVGVPMGLVIASIHERRDEYRKVLRGATGDETGREASEFRGRRSARG